MPTGLLSLVASIPPVSMLILFEPPVVLMPYPVVVVMVPFRVTLSLPLIGPLPPPFVVVWFPVIIKSSAKTGSTTDKQTKAVVPRRAA